MRKPCTEDARKSLYLSPYPVLINEPCRKTTLGREHRYWIFSCRLYLYWLIENSMEIKYSKTKKWLSTLNYMIGITGSIPCPLQEVRPNSLLYMVVVYVNKYEIPDVKFVLERIYESLDYR